VPDAIAQMKEEGERPSEHQKGHTLARSRADKTARIRFSLLVFVSVLLGEFIPGHA
jgi:hypothetical protein